MKVPSESFTKGPVSGWEVLIPGVVGFFAGSWVAGSLAWVSAGKFARVAGVRARPNQRDFRSICMGWIVGSIRE